MSTGNETAEHIDEMAVNFRRHVDFPMNLGTLEDPDGRAVGVGQCGDAIEVTLKARGERIHAIRYVPRGCAFTLACASAMSVLAANKTFDQALELSPRDVAQMLGGLPPDHQHCARLAINTLGEAIADCYRRRQAVHRPGQGQTEDESNANF